MTPVSIKAPAQAAQEAKTSVSQQGGKDADAQDIFRALMADFGVQALPAEAPSLASQGGHGKGDADGEKSPQPGRDADKDGKDLPQQPALSDLALLGLPMHLVQVPPGGVLEAEKKNIPDGRPALNDAGQDLGRRGTSVSSLTKPLLPAQEDFRVLSQGSLPDKQAAADTSTPPIVQGVPNLNQHALVVPAKTPVDAGSLPAPVGTPAWSHGLEQKVVWMLGRQEQHATLQLNPPQLGPLEIHLHIKDDQATALFVSPHGAVREAIEAAMPRLRDSFQDQGINLAGSCLSQNSAEQFAQREDSGRQPAFWGGQQVDTHLGTELGSPIQGTATTRGEGLVNLFA